MNTEKAPQKAQILKAQIEKISKKHTLGTPARRFLRTVTMIIVACSFSSSALLAVERNENEYDIESGRKKAPTDLPQILESYTIESNFESNSALKMVYVTTTPKIILECDFKNKSGYQKIADQFYIQAYPEVKYLTEAKIPGRARENDAEWLAGFKNIADASRYQNHQGIQPIQCKFSRNPSDERINFAMDMYTIGQQDCLRFTPSLRTDLGTTNFGITMLGIGNFFSGLAPRAFPKTATHTGNPVIIPIRETKLSYVHNISDNIKNNAAYQPHQPQNQKEHQTKKEEHYLPHPGYFIQGKQPQSTAEDYSPHQPQSTAESKPQPGYNQKHQPQNKGFDEQGYSNPLIHYGTKDFNDEYQNAQNNGEFNFNKLIENDIYRNKKADELIDEIKKIEMEIEKNGELLDDASKNRLKNKIQDLPKKEENLYRLL